MDFDGEMFWLTESIGFEDQEYKLVQVDLEGNIVSIISVGNNVVFDVTFNGENLLCSGINVNNQRATIFEVSLEGEIIREIDCSGIIEGFTFGLTWVDAHNDAPLWVIQWHRGVISQVDISNELPEIIQQTEVRSARQAFIEHDDQNMWYVGADSWVVIDDGQDEYTWMIFETGLLTLDPNEEVDLFINFNTESCVDGDYEAEISYVSNDPVTPELTTRIIIHVQTLGVESDVITPNEYSMNPAFPNPFNSMTSIPFEMSKESEVKIQIFDLSGRVVDEIIDRKLPAGLHTVNWNADNLSTGIYFIKMDASGFSSIQKVSLLR